MKILESDSVKRIEDQFTESKDLEFIYYFLQQCQDEDLKLKKGIISEFTKKSCTISKVTDCFKSLKKDDYDSFYYIINKNTERTVHILEKYLLNEIAFREKRIVDSLPLAKRYLQEDPRFLIFVSENLRKNSKFQEWLLECNWCSTDSGIDKIFNFFEKGDITKIEIAKKYLQKNVRFIEYYSQDIQSSKEFQSFILSMDNLFRNPEHLNILINIFSKIEFFDDKITEKFLEKSFELIKCLKPETLKKVEFHKLIIKIIERKKDESATDVIVSFFNKRNIFIRDAKLAKQYLENSLYFAQIVPMSLMKNKNFQETLLSVISKYDRNQIETFANYLNNKNFKLIDDTQAKKWLAIDGYFAKILGRSLIQNTNFRTWLFSSERKHSGVFMQRLHMGWTFTLTKEDDIAFFLSQDYRFVLHIDEKKFDDTEFFNSTIDIVLKKGMSESSNFLLSFLQKTKLQIKEKDQAKKLLDLDYRFLGFLPLEMKNDSAFINWIFKCNSIQNNFQAIDYLIDWLPKKHLPYELVKDLDVSKISFGKIKKIVFIQPKLLLQVKNIEYTMQMVKDFIKINPMSVRYLNANNLSHKYKMYKAAKIRSYFFIDCIKLFFRRLINLFNAT